MTAQAHQAHELMTARRLIDLRVLVASWLGVASLGISIVAVVFSLLAFFKQ